ncbi:hypothetical protein [Geodermatophilus sp. URMC 64]
MAVPALARRSGSRRRPPGAGRARAVRDVVVGGAEVLAALLLRRRLDFPPSRRLLWRVVAPIGLVMERRMLRRLARRSEGRPA